MAEEKAALNQSKDKSKYSNEDIENKMEIKERNMIIFCTMIKSNCEHMMAYAAIAMSNELHQYIRQHKNVQIHLVFV